MLLGVPYDGGTTYQPGARLAPYHVRRVSALVQSYHPVHRIDVFSRVRARDGGNVVFPPFDAAAVRAAVQAEVARVVVAGAAPFVVGGDHSVALPAMRAVAAVHGPLAVVHVDAHSDTSTPEVWGDAWHHGTPLRHAITEGLIAPGALVQIGVRGPWGGADDGLLRRPGRRHHHPCRRGRRARHGRRRRRRCAACSAIARSTSPSTSTASIPRSRRAPARRCPGGLSAREALQLVRGLWGRRLVGMDVVEVAPPLDFSDLTSHLAAHLLYEGLALLAHR